MTNVMRDDASGFQPQFIPPVIPGALTAIGLLAAIYVAGTEPALSLQAKAFMVLWLALSVACSVFLAPRNFTAGFLTSLACMLIGWRIAALNDIDAVTYPLLVAFLAFVFQFFDCIRTDLQRGTARLMSTAEWQLTFIRLYVGFDLVPHTTEKLFAGPSFFDGDVKAFAALDVPMPDAFVILGGFCELGIVIGIGLGLLTRLAGVGAALYYVIATIIGGNFFNGFIWVNPGGGWEYSALMIILFLTYTVRGAGPFSLDGVIANKGWMPSILRPLAVTRM